MSADTGLPARRAALAALRAVDEDGAYSNLAVPEAVSRLDEPRDRAFASHLAYETLRWEGTLDWALGLVLSRPLSDVEPALRRILRLGALQLLRSAVPARAAVSTSVGLAREAVPSRRAKGAGGFVNGVLRQLGRRIDDLPWPRPDVDPVGHLSLTTAHPAWIVTDLRPRLGDQRTREVLEADNAAPGLTLRATRDREALLLELRADGLDVREGAMADEALRVPGGDPRRLSAVEEGRAVPQDEASMVVARATGVRPGDRVLDLCAGPGGKAGHLAELAGPDGTVVAIELHAHRARLIEQVAARIGVDIDVRVGDALAPPLDAAARFDRVLLDAPCTGLGTGRRRPEVRWRRTPDEAIELADLQQRMLRSAASWVAPGGTLTYAVCTWTRAETTGVLEAIALPDGFVRESVRQLWPDRDDTDGMFVATYRRR